jgi:hypothetical protein
VISSSLSLSGVPCDQAGWRLTLVGVILLPVMTIRRRLPMAEVMAEEPTDMEQETTPRRAMAEVEEVRQPLRAMAAAVRRLRAVEDAARTLTHSRTTAPTRCPP